MLLPRFKKNLILPFKGEKISKNEFKAFMKNLLENLNIQNKN